MMASTSLLFYFRVSALYMDNKHVTRFFLFMWLALLGASLTAIIGVSGAPIGPTKHCVNVRLDRYLGIAVVIPTISDDAKWVEHPSSIELLQKLFKGRIWLGISRLEGEKSPFENEVIHLSEKLQIPIMAIHECLYLNREDAFS